MTKKELIEDYAKGMANIRWSEDSLIDTINEIIDSINSLPNGEASRVSENEYDGNLCDHPCCNNKKEVNNLCNYHYLKLTGNEHK